MAKRGRSRGSKNGSNLTAQQRSDLSWVAKHKENIEARNKAIVSILVLADIVLVAGVLNYYMLLQIPTAYFAQFFAEFGLLMPLMFINFKIIIRIGGSEDMAAVVAALTAAAVFVALVAVALALTAAAVALVAVALALTALAALAAVAEEEARK